MKRELAEGITVYRGDCRELLPTLSHVDAVVTDPPYSVSVSGVGRWELRYGRKPDLDFFEGDQDWQLMTAQVCEAIDLCVKILQPHGSLYIWCGHRQFGKLAERFEANGWKTRFLVWSKLNPPPAAPGSGWPSAAELCLYAYRPGRRWAWSGVCPYRSNVLVADSFRYGQPDKVDHPTQKPLGTIEPLVRSCTTIGDTVLDPFMGSATTAIACLRLGRKFVGIEVDNKYFDLACRRIEAELLKPSLFLEKPKLKRPQLLPKPVKYHAKN